MVDEDSITLCHQLDYLPIQPISFLNPGCPSHSHPCSRSRLANSSSRNASSSCCSSRSPSSNLDASATLASGLPPLIPSSLSLSLPPFSLDDSGGGLLAPLAVTSSHEDTSLVPLLRHPPTEDGADDAQWRDGLVPVFGVAIFVERVERPQVESAPGVCNERGLVILCTSIWGMRLN